MTMIERRGFCLGVGALAAGSALPVIAQVRTPTVIVNPLVPRRADAQIHRADDGWYYMMATVPDYDRLVIRRASTVAALATAPEVTVWTRPAHGRLAGYIWAPELHRFDGRWHIYFGAGNEGDPFHVRIHVLASADPNPLEARWALLGQVETPWDTFTLDPTSFVHRGVRYLAWAQQEPGIATNSNVYLAPLRTPTTLAAAPARLTVPTLEWETRGFKVNEGPAFLAHDDKVFISYSASATDANYCLGLLHADAGADIMKPASWTKSKEPVFRSDPVRRVWGPGHNSFTTDETGRDLLVYHARDYGRIVGDPLDDPNRSTRIQPFGWRADGMPDFGRPVAAGPLPSGQV